MNPFSTQYFKDYTGEDAHTCLHKDFYELVIEIDNLGIPLRKPKTQPLFEKDGKNLVAEDLVLLANEIPLAQAYLKGIKWKNEREGISASLSLSIRHFKGLNASFPALEEIAKQFNLTYKGTYQTSSG